MMTLGFALLSDTYPANQLGAAMGKVMIGQTLGLMVGPPVGGLLQDHVGEKAPYVFCIILIAIDLTARLLIIEPRSAKVLAIRAFQKQQQESQAMEMEQKQQSVDENMTGQTTLPAAQMTTMRGLLTNTRLITALVVSFTQAFLIAGTSPCCRL